MFGCLQGFRSEVASEESQRAIPSDHVGLPPADCFMSKRALKKLLTAPVTTLVPRKMQMGVCKARLDI